MRQAGVVEVDREHLPVAVKALREHAVFLQGYALGCLESDEARGLSDLAIERSRALIAAADHFQGVMEDAEVDDDD